MFFFFFQAEDGIRVAQESRGLGDVYKRQFHSVHIRLLPASASVVRTGTIADPDPHFRIVLYLSLIHI